MYYEDWISLGEKLGLSGGKLGEFVQQKETEFLEREERVRRREDEKRSAEMRFQLEMKERELEMEKMKLSNNERRGSSSTAAPRPKLPVFDESADDMDAYIERFERYAKSQNWPDETWAVSLSSLLTGKGLEVYTSLVPDEAASYGCLKKALLKRYELTEEGFRVKFRTSRQEDGENVFQFVSRLSRYLSRWTNLAGADTRFENLRDLLIKEQFLNSCGEELAIFLKERSPQSIGEMTRIAEQYREAHEGRSASTGTVRQFSREGPSIKKNIEKKTGRGCFTCGSVGHFARDCTLRREHFSAACATAKDKLQFANGLSIPIVRDE